MLGQLLPILSLLPLLRVSHATVPSCAHHPVALLLQLLELLWAVLGA